MNPLHRRLSGLVESLADGNPSRDALVDAVQQIISWKQEQAIPGLWDAPPVMVTATLDDAMGHGLELIHLYARAAGIQVVPLGLLQPPQAIIQACRARRAALLGLTVLQLFSDDDLIEVGRGIPRTTLFVAGGPVFRFDPDLAESARVDFVAPNAAAFLGFLLKNNSRLS